MPILGIMASQISGHLWAPSGAYDSIATTTVGSGGASSITFSSIPSTYTHLQIRALSKVDTTTNSDAYSFIQFNSDTTYTNYYTHYIYGTGTAAGAGGNQSSGYTGGAIIDTPYSGANQTSVFAGSVTDVLDYTNTNKYKTVRSLSGWDANGATGGSWITLLSALWLNTSAVSSITITCPTKTFAQYSQFALYGVKGQ
jgi:hypothetical protein